MSEIETTHILQCVHAIGHKRRYYEMPCNIIKTMRDGRLKVEVFGDRFWKENTEKRSVRYVPAYRVMEA